MAKVEIGKKPRHQFMSFPLEASHLSLNAVSSAASELWADPDSPTTSIFQSRIQHWADLNLTQVLMVFISVAVPNFTKLFPKINANVDINYNSESVDFIKKDILSH